MSFSLLLYLIEKERKIKGDGEMFNFFSGPMAHFHKRPLSLQ